MPQLLSVIKPSDSYIIQKLQSICKSYPVNFLNFCISICIKQNKKAGKNYPGNFLKSSSKYSGNGAVNSIYSPVRGCTNPKIPACSVCP